jgi:hypothetical protein
MSQLASPRPTLNARTVLLRIGAALLGGYALVWGFVTLTISGLVALGEDFDDAWMLAMMLGFVLYLAVFLWAFAVRSLWRAWMLPLVCGGLMTGAAMLISRSYLVAA